MSVRACEGQIPNQMLEKVMSLVRRIIACPFSGAASYDNAKIAEPPMTGNCFPFFHAVAFEWFHSAWYISIISSTVGTRGLFAGEPDANACCAIVETTLSN